MVDWRLLAELDVKEQPMYAGDVTPQEAFDALRTNPDAVLVDVRTQPELVFVGTPDLSGVGKRLVVVEWQTQPPGASNHQFVDHLKAAGVEDSMPVYFLCRSGARSRAAAMLATAAGYEEAYNVDAGFEGTVDAGGPSRHNKWVEGFSAPVETGLVAVPISSSAYLSSEGSYVWLCAAAMTRAIRSRCQRARR